MLNRSLRTITSMLSPGLLALAFSATAIAQTPSPTPANPATQPPGTQQQPPTMPPATQQPSPQTPPGVNVAPTTQPSPVQPVTQEPSEPNFPSTQPQPLPPLPDLSRVGVISSNVLSLSLTDAIRKALQNNNDIAIARDGTLYASDPDFGKGTGRIWRIIWTVLTREAGGRVKRCSAIASALGIS